MFTNKNCPSELGSSPTATGTAGQAGGEEDEANEDQV